MATASLAAPRRRVSRATPTTKRKRRTRKELARRVDRILRTEPHYVYHSSFEHAEAEEVILGEAVTADHRPSGRTSAEADFYVAFLYRTDPLTREQEYELFRRMNYLKFRANCLRQRLDPADATWAEVDAIEALMEEARRLRNFIVESNLRLVTSRAKHFVRTTGLPLDELISEGNLGLVQAVEHFDFSRGTKLSTYATWAITNKLLAYLNRSRRHAHRFSSDAAEALDVVEDQNGTADETARRGEVRELLESLLGQLKDRERMAVEHRFGLTPSGKSQTLKELAAQWGVTKQRAQQVCAAAMAKLRAMLEQSGFETAEI